MCHQLVKRFPWRYMWVGCQALDEVGVESAVEARELFELVFKYFVMLADNFLTDVGVFLEHVLFFLVQKFEKVSIHRLGF